MRWCRLLKIIAGSMTATMLLSACSPKTEIDPATAVEQMKDKIALTDQFEQLDKDGACRVYGVDEELVEDSAALAGSGATAESLSVWKANSAEHAKKIEEQLSTFLDGYLEGYSEYKPEEVPKLESAILSQEGNYVILCVSAGNEDAQAVIDQIFHP